MRRIILIGILLFIFEIGIVIRLFYLQILRGEYYRKQAALQHFSEFTLPATRGEILASDSTVIVTNQPAYLTYAQVMDITDIQGTAEKIAPLISMVPEDLAEILSLPKRVFIPLAHKVSESVMEEIKKLNMPGIGFARESVRFYPEASMSAQVLGFVGSDSNGDDKGYFGLEGYYDRALRGKDGYLRQEKDVHGAPIVIGDITRFDAENGQTITTHIDKTVQRIAEEELSAGITKYGAKSGTVTIMNPMSGGIIAMAAVPSYDPNRYQQYTFEEYKNPIVASSYEPGSTFKVLVMAAGINEKAVNAQTVMNEDGPVRIGEYLVKTWNEKYNGLVTMTDVIVHSSNVGMVFVGRKMGANALLTAIKSFGFGQPTGVDLEEETSPDLRPEDEWKEIDYATATFGQGIAVTPIQMIRAVAAIANGGYLMEPHVAMSITDAEGKTVDIKPKRIRRVINESTAGIVTEMMIAAVDRGEAKWAKPKGYRIAGKTGTAQIPVAGHYDDKKTIASFVGFAPADNPKFVILVTIQEPSTSPWGSETAAPLFFAIAKKLLVYYGFAPEQY